MDLKIHAVLAGDPGQHLEITALQRPDKSSVANSVDVLPWIEEGRGHGNPMRRDGVSMWSDV